MLFVMFFLAGDIFRHRRDIRFADAENSVACLPFKIWAPSFSNGTRGICFYDAGKFGRSLCLASLEQCDVDRRTVEIEIQFRSEGDVRECSTADRDTDLLTYATWHFA